MLTIEEFLLFAHNSLAYEQRLVSVIQDGKQHYCSSASDLYEGGISIKLEGMERYSEAIWRAGIEFAKFYDHVGPVTCHAFYAPAHAWSFEMHTDPDDVVIYCCEGTKTMIVAEEELQIRRNESILIPANTPHKATNEQEALTLSFGLEKYLVDKSIDYELDILHKDDRNL